LCELTYQESQRLLSLPRTDYAVPHLKGVRSIQLSKNLLTRREVEQGLKLAQQKGQTMSSKTNLDLTKVSESSATDINRVRTETTSSQYRHSHKSL